MRFSDHITRMDVQFTKYIQRFDNPATIFLMKFVTGWASQGLIIAMLTILSLYAVITARWEREIILLVCSSLSVLTASILKVKVEKPRPDGNIIKAFINEKTYNFPSGHASISVSFYGFLAFLFFIYHMPVVAGIVLILVIAICFSRIFLGAHYLTDVIGGAILGGMNLLLLTWLYGILPAEMIQPKHVLGIIILGLFGLFVFYRPAVKSVMARFSEREKRLAVGCFMFFIVIELVHLGGISFLMLMVLLWLMGIREIRKTTKDIRLVISAIIVFSILIANIVYLRHTSEFLAFLALISAWATDSAAYFVGKKWGKTKIFPKISPNKSLEGTVGGILFAMILINSIFPDFLRGNWKILVLSIVLAITAVVGDLLESAFKRYIHTKDSGDALPGHGGILDRIDSSLMNCLVMIIIHAARWL